MKISLEDFGELFFSAGEDSGTIFVFDDEEDMDYFARGTRNVEILFTLHSDLKASAYLQEKYWKAPVTGFYAIGEDKIAAMIDLDAQTVTEESAPARSAGT